MEARIKRVLLISNTVMHYRVSVYNYFFRRFADEGWEWSVLTNQIQPQNQVRPDFRIEELPFNFGDYRRRIREINPDAVILFFHLKDRILWPLIHWLKWSGIPFAAWTKTKNLDAPKKIINRAMFKYFHWMSDGLILYSSDLKPNLSRSEQAKAFSANNTINHEAFPKISEDRSSIKRSLGIPFEKIVLFVGRMGMDSGRKRVDLLIEIFRDIGGRNAGLVIVGSGMRPEWQSRMNPKTTIYLSEIHDPENRQIARIFSASDICVIPGHVGLGLNQALFFGLPVVTMEGRQPPEIAYLQAGRNGFIVPNSDVQQLEDRIFQLLDDDGLRGAFSSAAREDFLRNASIESMYQGFRECVLYMDGLRRRPRLSELPSGGQNKSLP